MELRQLRHFLAVLESGSVGVASRHLNMSQPALTKSLQALERSLEVPLFTRARQGMTPTPFARSLALHARIIVTEADHAQRDMHEISGSERGRVVIGTVPAFGLAVLPRAVSRFQEASPQVEVALIEGFHYDLLPKLKTGELDYLFMTRSSLVDVDPDIVGEVLLPRFRAVVVASTRHPLAGRRRVTPQQIVAGPWAISPGVRPFSRMFEDMFIRFGLQPPQAAVQYSTIPMAKALVSEGRYLTFISETLVEEEIKAGELCALAVPEITWERDLAFYIRREMPPTPAAAKLLAEIKAVCAEIMAHRDAKAPRPHRRSKKP
jgi:DNA-binding transcriptional LysR family regulator